MDEDDLSDLRNRKIGFVFQSFNLVARTSALANVELPLAYAGLSHAERRRRATDALEAMCMADRLHHQPSELSGGQQQRVAVARALVNRPAVLLLDEPLGALDLQLRKRLQVELSQIQREIGTTFVFVTHDQGEAMTMADRIAVMNEGRLEQIGTAEEIYRRPNSRFVADFIGESNFTDVEFVDGAVVTMHGRIRLTAPPVAASGTGVLMIRPECVRLTPASEGDPGLIGTVVKVSFLGSATRASVLCPAVDAPFIVDIPSGLDHQIRATSLVQLTWDVKDTVVLDTPAG
jgi:ABC-type Fe3+/spermidine/putrescine transport system ATPase subunit